MIQSRKLFLPFSRQYNNALALASIECNEQMQQGFNPTFRIQSKLHHRPGNLFSPVRNDPKFVQIFFHDSSKSPTGRLRLSDRSDAEILEDFQDCLYTSNCYIQSFKKATKICVDEENLEFCSQRFHQKDLLFTNK